MKLSSDSSLFHLTHESFANFASLPNFDKKSIHHLPKIFKNSIPAIDADASNKIGAEAAFAGVNMSSISARRLITAANSDKCYGSMEWFLIPYNVSYSTVLSTFKIDH